MTLNVNGFGDGHRPVKPAGSSTSISPLAGAVSWACWKVRQGEAKLQGLPSEPVADTNTRCACAGAACIEQAKMAVTSRA